MKMVTDPTLDDDRWGLFVPYKRKFWFEKNDYDVPESYFYQNGEKIKPNTIELVKRFLKQVRESRGYDVDCYPPSMFESPFSPMPLEEMRQSTCNIRKTGYARVVRAAELAIQNICEETGHRYKLVKVERAICILTRPGVYFLTLTAEEDGGPVQTIQAQVYYSIEDHPVLHEWRFKPIPAQNACYVAVQQSKFHADKAKRSIQEPPLDALRAGSGRVRDLNIQFASWTQSQLQNHPDERWEDGVQGYLNRAESIMEIYGDAVNWLRTNAVKQRGVAKIPSEDARTKPLWKSACLYNNNGRFTFGGSEVSVPGIGNANVVASNEPDGGYVAVQTQSKIAVMGPQFHADKGETSIRQLPLDLLRDKSPGWHVTNLNIQFASWIQSQLQNHPDELWEDGVEDYLIRARCLRELFGDAVNWLGTDAVKRRCIANISSEYARTKHLFAIGKSSHTLFSDKPMFTAATTAWRPALFSGKPMFPAATTASSGTPWRPALFLDKPLFPAATTASSGTPWRPALFLDKPLFPAATTASSGTPWRPALLFHYGPFTFGGSEVSVPGIGYANAVTSNEPDGGGKAAARPRCFGDRRSSPSDRDSLIEPSVVL
ncbi:Pleckstrin homology (PH) domain superfamily protein [Striga hermonthica]|uniref:Pleckstrin homology (PH) domain superfamily protein n=1 Tax=Striga hermonthica TaxID=68872 RepID=A0A9N7NME8_STRHE|nr:Pleckstrin homology (PH) domain superfamily protein [Striga hermonthica]